MQFRADPRTAERTRDREAVDIADARTTVGIHTSATRTNPYAMGQKARIHQIHAYEVYPAEPESIDTPTHTSTTCTSN